MEKIQLTAEMRTRAATNGLGETEVSHFQQLLEMDAVSMTRNQQIDAGILGFKAAGLNPKLRADGTFGLLTDLACDAFEVMDDDEINVNLALAGLSKADAEIEPSIELDGTIGPVAMSALKAFRKLSKEG